MPNEGARRLAWWLTKQGPGAIERLAKRLSCGVLTVLRYVEGEIEPGAAVSFRLSRETDHFVVTRDWRSPPAGGWTDRPAPRQYRIA